MASIHPYLNFSGNCEEAFRFYRSVFGGELSDLNRFSEAPSELPSPESEADKIMHVSLPIGDGQVLMGSDRPASMGPTTAGDNMHVSVSPDSAEEARRIFDGLSEGGRVTMPFERAFWGADFGMCTDKFGINWMVNYDPNQAG
ncbi:MAG TPA: VOC family protein [Acidimicrobiia bacterium]